MDCQVVTKAFRITDCLSQIVSCLTGFARLLPVQTEVTYDHKRPHMINLTHNFIYAPASVSNFQRAFRHRFVFYDANKKKLVFLTFVNVGFFLQKICAGISELMWTIPSTHASSFSNKPKQRNEHTEFSKNASLHGNEKKKRHYDHLCNLFVFCFLTSARRSCLFITHSRSVGRYLTVSLFFSILTMATTSDTNEWADCVACSSHVSSCFCWGISRNQETKRDPARRTRSLVLQTLIECKLCFNVER